MNRRKNIPVSRVHIWGLIVMSVLCCAAHSPIKEPLQSAYDKIVGGDLPVGGAYDSVLLRHCGISFVSSSRVLCTHHFLFYCLQYVINIHSISFFGAARSWICRFRLTLPSNPIAVVVPAILHAKIAHPDLNLDLDISSSDCHVVSRTSRIFCVALGNVIDNSRVRWPWR